MNTVGPTTKMKNTRRAAATALALESHLMPRSTPETAEMTKHAVSTAMTSAAATVPYFSWPKTLARPPVICSAPRPREVAEPKRVARIARVSMPRPAAPSARAPMSGRNAALMRLP